MAKFTVKFYAWQSSGEALNISPSRLHVYMNVYPIKGSSSITQLAMQRTDIVAMRSLIPQGASSPLVASIQGKSQLIAPQALNDLNKIITVWYDRDLDGVKDEADEVYTLDLSTVSVSRPSGGNTFAFNANEHITLTINLTMGKSLGVGTVTVADWATGTGWDDGEGELVP
jgi:hypothetical protein